MPYTSITANRICATPLDNKSVNPQSISISSQEFVEKYYAEPVFRHEETIRNQEHEEKNAFDIFLPGSEWSGQLTTMLTEEMHFKNWLDGIDNSKVYTLSGNSGTGKTTYLHRLKFCEKKEHVWTIIDVYLSTIPIYWYDNICTNIPNFQKTVSKVYAAILTKIQEIFFPKNNKANNEIRIYNNIKNILRNYKNAYKNKMIVSHDLFDSLVRKIKSFTLLKPVSARIKELATCFFKFFRNTPREEYLVKSLDVLVYALYCKNVMTDKYYILAFDNLERFIKMDEIFNIEIDELRRSLADYIRGLNGRGRFSHLFKIILAIRCTTARMCGVKLHSADEDPSDLDLSGWFNIDEIIDCHVRYWNDHNIEVRYYKLIRQIVGDKRKCGDDSITGLEIFLSPLFNYNKRLIIDFLGIIVENLKNKEQYPYKEMIEAYKKLWKENTMHSRCGARNIIKGIVLNKLKYSDNLFVHLKMSKNVHPNDGEIGLDVCRRFLTTLYNLSEVNAREDISLTNLLNSMYYTDDISNLWKDRIFRKTISEMIYYMNSYNRRTNDWIQFIDVQITEQIGTIVIDTVEKLEDIISNNMDYIYITLMPAGIVYLKYIMMSFEYFAVLYSKNYRPLYSLVPSQDEILKCTNIKQLSCCHMIRSVRDAANRYINNIKDTHLVLGSHANSKNTFSSQLIIAHTSFLDNYVNYINSLISGLERKTVDGPITRNITAISKYKELVDYILQLRQNYLDTENAR